MLPYTLQPDTRALLDLGLLALGPAGDNADPPPPLPSAMNDDSVNTSADVPDAPSVDLEDAGSETNSVTALIENEIVSTAVYGVSSQRYGL